MTFSVDFEMNENPDVAVKCNYPVHAILSNFCMICVYCLIYSAYTWDNWCCTAMSHSSVDHFVIVFYEILTDISVWNSLPLFSGVCVARSLVLCVVSCRSSFVILSFFFWPLCCQSIMRNSYLVINHTGIFIFAYTIEIALHVTL